MNIKVNGEDLQIAELTLAELLEELKVVSARVAVEVNLNIVKKADYDKYMLAEGDVVEIVNFVGGG